MNRRTETLRCCVKVCSPVDLCLLSAPIPETLQNHHHSTEPADWLIQPADSLWVHRPEIRVSPSDWDCYGSAQLAVAAMLTLCLRQLNTRRRSGDVSVFCWLVSSVSFQFTSCSCDSKVYLQAACWNKTVEYVFMFVREAEQLCSSQQRSVNWSQRVKCWRLWLQGGD